MGTDVCFVKVNIAENLVERYSLEHFDACMNIKIYVQTRPTETVKSYSFGGLPLTQPLGGKNRSTRRRIFSQFIYARWLRRRSVDARTRGRSPVRFPPQATPECRSC